jgi:hypothetical protein
MIKKTVSKCGARFYPKKEVELLHSEKPIKQFEEEKPIQKKTLRSWTKKTPKIEVGDFANIEDEI